MHIDVRTVGEKNVNPKVSFVTDLWSLAVTIARLATKSIPYKNTADMKQERGQKPFDNAPNWNRGLSGEFAAFIYFLVSRPRAYSFHYLEQPVKLFRDTVFRSINVIEDLEGVGQPIFDMAGKVARVLKARDERKSRQIINKTIVLSSN